MEGTCLDRRDQFCFRQVKSEMPTGYLGGNVKQTVTYLSPESQRVREAWATDED